MKVHLQHLAYVESLWPEFDCYRLESHRHAGYKKLLRELRQAKSAIIASTKFDRFFLYRLANIHYLVIEPDLVNLDEVPVGWGLLVRQGLELTLTQKPTWQDIDFQSQLFFLQRMAFAR